MRTVVCTLLLVLLMQPVPAAEEAVPGGRTAADADRSGAASAWVLSTAELARLAEGRILAEADMIPGRVAADVRAAIQVAAPPERVFRTLTDCTKVLKIIPHLKRCTVLDSAPDESWKVVEQQIDYGLFAPRAEFVFRVDYERYGRIRFRHVSGDFVQNEGTWEFRPASDGRSTLVTYRARLQPAFYVPRWMMRSMLRRDLPELMRGLRLASEAPAPVSPGR